MYQEHKCKFLSQNLYTSDFTKNTFSEDSLMSLTTKHPLTNKAARFQIYSIMKYFQYYNVLAETSLTSRGRRTDSQERTRLWKNTSNTPWLKQESWQFQQKIVKRQVSKALKVQKACGVGGMGQGREGKERNWIINFPCF